MTAPGAQESGDRVEIRVRGGMMPVWLIGEGPPLLLLHGISANHTEWLSVARLISTHYRVILLDLLGRLSTRCPGRSRGILDEAPEGARRFAVEPPSHSHPPHCRHLSQTIDPRYPHATRAWRSSSKHDGCRFALFRSVCRSFAGAGVIGDTGVSAWAD